MKNKSELRVPGDGFKLRLAQAFVYALCAVVFIALDIRFGSDDFRFGSDDLLLCVFTSFATLFILYTILQFIVAYKGRKSVKANTLGLVLNSILFWVAPFGIAGCAKGRMHLQYDAFECNETSSKELKKNETHLQVPGDGFKLRLTQAIIYLIVMIMFVAPIIVCGIKIKYADKWIIGYYVIMTSLSAGFFALFLLYTILQFVVAYKGRKSVKANNLGLVLNGILFFIAPFGIAGCAKGRMHLQYDAFGCTEEKMREEARARAAAAKAAREAAAAENAARQNSAAPEKEVTRQYAITEAEYIKPKMSKKGKTAMMITLAVSYALLLIAGILLAAVPSLSSVLSGMGICEEICAPAYGITIGVMWVALVPSFGYYFATVSPFDLSKKTKIIIAVISTVLLAAMVAAFFLITNFVNIDVYGDGLILVPVKEFYEGSDTWFVPVSMVFAALGIVICYLLTLFKIDPTKIKDIKSQKTGSGLFNTIKHIFISVIGLILGLVKGILKFKEKQPDIFILIATLLLTWLVFFTAFIFAIICIVVLLGVVIMYFGGVMHWALDKNTGGKKAYTYVNSMGCTQTIYSDNGRDFYNADGRYVGSSDDGGQHINIE